MTEVLGHLTTPINSPLTHCSGLIETRPGKCLNSLQDNYFAFKCAVFFWVFMRFRYVSVKISPMSVARAYKLDRF